MSNKYFTVKFFCELALGWFIFSLYGCGGQVATHKEAVAVIKEETVAEKIPKHFAAGDGQGEIDDGWLKDFHDPVLNSLVDEALAANPGLKIAQAKVDQANGLNRQAAADLKPTMGLGGGYSDNEYQAGIESAAARLGISWEADVWGRIRSSVAGSDEFAAATEADYQFARQSLAASVANGWFMATTAKFQVRFAQEIAGLQEKSLEIAEAMQKIGKGSSRDVHLARAATASAREGARYALSAYENSLRSLELLLGRYPSADIETTDTLVAVPPPIPAGIPSQVLERRPDLIAAEDRVAAAFYKQKEAELLHLPSFRFSLGLGINSINDAIAGLAAGIVAPLYTGGEIEGKVEVATAKQKEAIAAYAQAALNAFKEVESSLAAEEHLLKRQEFLRIEVAENRQAYEQTKKQYEIGQISMLDVLTVQKKWINSRMAELDMAGRRLVNRVNLHLALGGGFEESQGK
ncbi:MAG: TolC family protein [Thermodesulfobacteriota bacterium]|nr:TolC family protein [Thermodesulfobacteriota bacterium]